MRKNIGQQNKEDAFIQEVKEELKNEKIRNIWNNYGLYIIAFIVAVLTAAVSFETKLARQKAPEHFRRLRSSGCFAGAGKI